MAGIVLSQRDADRIQRMIRWFESTGKQLSPNMFRRRNIPTGGGKVGKIFEVQSAAAGDGVYNCYEQKLDATKWTDTDGDDKFVDKCGEGCSESDEVEVLNLAECSPKTDVHHALSAGTLLAAWQIADDSSTTRWIGQIIVLWDICEEV